MEAIAGLHVVVVDGETIGLNPAGAVVVGRNVGFNRRTLMAYGRRVGGPPELARFADTYEMARPFVGVPDLPR
ncbi:hypothetical protein U7230_07735 [Carboxydochorda subterranea]|uniref:Uncharacterized protein n=1 Tax=Carboxydichorda subterranea TaxID=3109565 RepID=A0ABZ1C258_9FIRM|nr:hypothetical protein [Limnochorda sp. L945t]WRP18871.1 hypothetical protein U7230_07735 [Limnochorda sp. L945t]